MPFERVASTDRAVDAVPLEKRKPCIRAEHERRGRQRVGDHRRRRNDRGAGETAPTSAARIQDVRRRRS